MAVKIIDVVISPVDKDISWNGLQNTFSDFRSIKELSDWRDVNHVGVDSPLTVTVGTGIKVIVTAVDTNWKYISDNFQDWSVVKSEFTNWNSILNYH